MERNIRIFEVKKTPKNWSDSTGEGLDMAQEKDTSLEKVNHLSGPTQSAGAVVYTDGISTSLLDIIINI